MSQAKGFFRILCLRQSSFSCLENMHRGKSGAKMIPFTRAENPLPSFLSTSLQISCNLCWKISRVRHCNHILLFNSHDGGKSINLSNHIFNSFMLSASMASCSNELHNFIRDCLKKYFLLFVQDLLTISWRACTGRNNAHSSPLTSSMPPVEHISYILCILYIVYIYLYFLYFIYFTYFIYLICFIYLCDLLLCFPRGAFLFSLSSYGKYSMLLIIFRTLHWDFSSYV